MGFPRRVEGKNAQDCDFRMVECFEVSELWGFERFFILSSSQTPSISFNYTFVISIHDN